jgi:hypothetical protein
MESDNAEPLIIIDMRQKEIFEALALSTYKSVENINDWERAILYIQRIPGSVGFRSSYLNDQSELIPIDTEAGYLEGKLVHELYEITTTQFPIHANWNRAVFTLSPDHKFEIEYIWDQELHDELESFGN